MDEKTRLYGNVTRLIKITIEGEEYEVPDQLELLRCYQYLDFSIAYENFCWNASCENCAAQMLLKGKPEARVLCCQIPAEDGMVIPQLPKGVSRRAK